MLQEGTGSFLFVSVPDFSKSNRFGSVRFGELNFPFRRGSACVFRTRRGSVWFGSFPRPVPAGSRIKRFGSVRFGRFGSAYYSFLLCIIACWSYYNGKHDISRLSPVSAL